MSLLNKCLHWTVIAHYHIQKIGKQGKKSETLTLQFDGARG